MRCLCLLVAAAFSAMPAPAQEKHPNILWITAEDHGPHLGAYGDTYAITPNLDKLGARGIRYAYAWSNAPVCAPARTTIISGLFPTSTGSANMRSLVSLPRGMRMFPALLREAGYYTSNNVKEDYNLVKADDVWDDSSRTAHWRNRKPGQPFFAVFNIMETHESYVHRQEAPSVHPAQKGSPEVHDPARVRVPAYQPDTPEVRADWAHYHDNITLMDRMVGERLAELEADGLAEDTIVFFYSDHGPGLPRSKRFAYNSGLQVPLIVSIPAKWKALAPPDYAAGALSLRPVSFVDLAPTVLSLAGRPAPDWMQGRAFLGRHIAPAPQYLFGFSERMDERYDLVRSVRDRRFVYLRNYMPHRVSGQYRWYMFLMPTTRVWKRLYDENALRPPRTYFWETKPAEELYDLESDPDEVRNLAESAEHRAVLERLRSALDEHARRIRDVGFLPEYALHRLKAPDTPYDLGHDPKRYDLDAVRKAASDASDVRVATAEVRRGLASGDEAVRYWAATGMVVRGREAVAAAEADLLRLVTDPGPGPRIAAAEALARYGSAPARARAIDLLLKDADAGRSEEYVSLLALNALVQVQDLPASALAVAARLPEVPATTDQRENYVPQLLNEVEKGLR